MNAGQEWTLAQLGETTERGFKAVAEDLADIRKEMATKEDIADINTEMMERFDHVEKQFRAIDARLRDMAADVAVIHRGIERLEEQGASNAGFSKDINHLLMRIPEIERKLETLGIEKKMAA